MVTCFFPNNFITKTNITSIDWTFHIKFWWETHWKTLVAATLPKIDYCTFFRYQQGRQLDPLYRRRYQPFILLDTVEMQHASRRALHFFCILMKSTSILGAWKKRNHLSAANAGNVSSLKKTWWNTSRRFIHLGWLSEFHEFCHRKLTSPPPAYEQCIFAQ